MSNSDTQPASVSSDVTHKSIDEKPDAFEDYHGDPNEKPEFLGANGKKLNLYVSCLASTGFLLFGYDQGVMGSLLSLDSFRETFRTIDTYSNPDNSTLQGFTIAVYEIGCFMGAISTLYLGDKLGRLKIMFIGCIIMIIGAILQCTSFGLAQLIVARIITGIGNGMNTSTVPVWQSECAKPSQRGKLIAVAGAMITGGIMISYWIDFGFYFTKGTVSWRFPIAFQIVFALIILPVVFKLPESPRWLLKKGRYEEARKVFAALEGTILADEKIHRDLLEVKASLDEENLSGGDNAFNLKILFTQGEHRNFHRMMLGLWSQIMQQICGINLITYYAGTIYEKYIGMTPLNSRILAACNGTEYFIASWIAFYTVESFGRRKLKLWGAAGQSATMAILTGCSWAADKKGDNHAAIAAAVFLFVFNTFFGASWLSLAWLYPAEINSLAIRAPANGVSTAGNWLFNFMVVMITPVAFENIGSYTYTIFAAINFLMVPTVYFLYPETAGRSLEEMDRIFAACDPWKPWDIVKIAEEMPYEEPQGKHHVGYRKDDDPEKGTSEFVEGGLFENHSDSN
ncbi:hypothetical protein BVG19_g1417 [[Candida] boidinii]|nr:hypothetical protein BVG19_g1417 [[Candida] boidinii]OWB50868.1 hypothetical protein B5S27_g2421 [[Candida] boidinii]